MRHIKNFRKFESFGTQIFQFEPTKRQLHFLNDNCHTWIFDYYTGRINAYKIQIKDGFTLPDGIKFGKITSFCDLSGAGITDADVLPRSVGDGLFGPLIIKKNLMKNLKNCTPKVSGSFFCYDCPNLESLEGGPEEVGGDYYVHLNKLKNLTGSPKTINGDFCCGPNPFESLEGAPEIITGKFILDDIVIEEGKWGPKAWLELLEKNYLTAFQKKLIVSLFNPEFLRKQLLIDEAETLIYLTKISHNSEIEKFIQQELTDRQREIYKLIKDLDNLIEL
jgi:hypothetical protein